MTDELLVVRAQLGERSPPCRYDAEPDRNGPRPEIHRPSPEIHGLAPGRWAGR
ncbi:hypothetical protein Misp03_44660 [Microbispora sp. NBRC 16548]|nr:hypothetical protein Misp03_44660 [Microbispora sp. NBRC 16548]